MRFAALVLVATLAGAGPGWAGSPFYEMTEAQKRKTVVPDIRALTNCVARVTLYDPDAAVQYRAGLLPDYVAKQLQKCPREMNALLDLYESTYGDGEAERFIKGPYLADLPRAVLSLIRPQLDAKVDAAKEADRRAAIEEASRQRVEEQRLAEQESAAVKAEAEAAAAASKAEAEKRDRIDTATRSMIVLRDKFYDCADGQLPGLVKSGESADVLASAAMTICGKPLSDVQDAAVGIAKEKAGSSDAAGEELVREQVRALVKERVVADAVQAKAGVGAFANVSR